MWVEAVIKNQSLYTLAPASVTTTAAPIATTIGDIKPVHQGITVQADPGNGAVVIYVGDSTVTTTNGIALAAGASFTFPVFNPASIWAVGSGSGALRIAYV